METLTLSNLNITLTREEENVRALSAKKNVLLKSQQIETVAELIEHNYEFVLNHYNLMINDLQNKFNPNDLKEISVLITLHYLYMYNSWRFMYKNQLNRDLKFNPKDFENPATHDILFKYFITNYPDDWESKCCNLMKMEISELIEYYAQRVNFYNK